MSITWPMTIAEVVSLLGDDNMDVICTEGGKMPSASVGDQRYVQSGVNEAGDPVYSRSTYYEDIETTGAAAQRAAELGVDLSTVDGTGKGGRITKADVEKASGLH